jgi:hypothetical protein
MMAKNSKGVLLTLLTILLFILMLGILITYVILNINANNLASEASLNLETQSAISMASASAHNFLAESLSDAVRSITMYEGTPALRHDHFINNTASTLQSLMYNGTAFGSSIPNMTVTFSNYTARLEAMALQQGIKLAVENYSITVYQSTPYSINATYTALDIINATGGTIYYPVNVSVGMPLNGTLSVSSAEKANPTPIAFGNSTTASIVGNVQALYGSQAPFMFVYGTIIVNSSASSPTCASIPQKFQNPNFILAAANSVDINQSVCNMGGLITIKANATAPPSLKPYLVYGASSGIFNSLSTGSAFLLDGPALELLNISAVRYYAVQKGLYFASKFVPSYMDSAAGLLTDKSPYGIFSFGDLGTKVATFVGNEYISVPNEPSLDPANAISAFAWIDSSSNTSAIFDKEESYGMSLGSIGDVPAPKNLVGNGIFSAGIAVNGESSGANAICQGYPFPLLKNTWYFVGYTYNGTSIDQYVDGVPYCSYPQSGSVMPSSKPLVFGGPNNTDEDNDNDAHSDITVYVNASLANVQLYNTSLQPQQVSRLYEQGIRGIPISGAGLFGWWPLDGNANDYSGNGNNGQDFGVNFTSPAGYFGDPAFKDAIGQPGTREAQGVLNCANINQCSNSSIGHVYLGSNESAFGGNVLVNESSIFGLSKAMLPNVLGLSGFGNYNNGNGTYVYPNNGFRFANWTGFTISLWVYPYSLNGVIVDQAMQPEINSGSHRSLIELVNGNIDVIRTPTSCTPVGSIPADKWSSIIMTGHSRGPSVITFTAYINGVKNVSVPGVPLISAGAVNYSLGTADASNCGSGSWFNGLVSDYAIRNATLTASQVQQLYANNSVPGSANALVAYWPLSSGFNGMMNETPDAENGYPAHIWNANVSVAGVSGSACPNSRFINNGCRASYTHP